MTYQNNGVQLSRRAFLKGGALVLTSTTLDQPLSAMGLTETELSVGVEVRKVLEKSGKVLAVLQGHNHKNELRDIGGIHYCTMVAMVEGSGAENSGYSMMKLANDGTIRIEGIRKQADYRHL